MATRKKRVTVGHKDDIDINVSIWAEGHSVCAAASVRKPQRLNVATQGRTLTSVLTNIAKVIMLELEP